MNDHLHGCVLRILVGLPLVVQAGDHVKVTSGESAGETGMVVRVEEAVAVVFLDSTKTEIRVFKRDLSESTEIISLDRCKSFLHSSLGERLSQLSCFRLASPCQVALRAPSAVRDVTYKPLPCEGSVSI